MKLFRLLTIISLLCMQQVSKAQIDSSEWKSIFNNKNLDGWSVKAKPEDIEKEYWYVENNCIVANSMGDSIHDYMWLLTEKEYVDFELKLKFKVCRESKGNSGIQIRSRYDDSTGWLNGPQIDINPINPFRCGMIWDETIEINHWIYPWILKDDGWVEPDMVLNPVKFYYCNDEPQWNEMFVKVKDYHVTCFLNGVQVTDFEGATILNDSIHHKYQVGSKGYIALQIHRKDQLKIYFKNIFIKEL